MTPQPVMGLPEYAFRSTPTEPGTMTHPGDEMLDASPSDDHRHEAAASTLRRQADEPDVLLDVPQLSVDEISLEVDHLQARVSLHAEFSSS